MRFDNLTEYKEKRGLSMADIAQEFGVTAAHLSMILAGKRVPSRKLAKKISEKTGIPVLNLLYPVDKRKNEIQKINKKGDKK